MNFYTAVTWSCWSGRGLQGDEESVSVAFICSKLFSRANQGEAGGGLEFQADAQLPHLHPVGMATLRFSMRYKL